MQLILFLFQKMSKTITLNQEGRLVFIEDGKENILSDEQCASFFDKPNSPGYLYTMYLIKVFPEKAKTWLELKLLQSQFFKVYMEIEKRKNEIEDEE